MGSQWPVNSLAVILSLCWANVFPPPLLLKEGLAHSAPVHLGKETGNKG